MIARKESKTLLEAIARCLDADLEVSFDREEMINKEVTIMVRLRDHIRGDSNTKKIRSDARVITHQDIRNFGADAWIMALDTLRLRWPK